VEYGYITDNNLENRQSYQYSGFQGESFLAAYKESRNLSVLKGSPVIQENELADYCANIAKDYYSKPVKGEYIVLRRELCAFLLCMLNQQPRPKGTGYVGSDRHGLYAGSNTLEPKADAAIETALKGGVLDPPANKSGGEAEYSMFDGIVKTFEVRKRLYHCYNSNFRPLDESDFYDCGLYPLFGCGLVFAYKEKRNLKYLNSLLKLDDTLISLKDKLNNFELETLRYLLSEEMRMVQAVYHGV
jgi:hypothetical protein